MCAHAIWYSQETPQLTISPKSPDFKKLDTRKTERQIKDGSQGMYIKYD